MNTLLQDLRSALRQVHRALGFALTAVFILALGNAATRPAWGDEVRGQFFEVMGTKPFLGRLLRCADDDHPGAVEVAMVTWPADEYLRPQRRGQDNPAQHRRGHAGRRTQGKLKQRWTESPALNHGAKKKEYLPSPRIKDGSPS